MEQTPNKSGPVSAYERTAKERVVFSSASWYWIRNKTQCVVLLRKRQNAQSVETLESFIRFRAFTTDTCKELLLKRMFPHIKPRRIYDSTLWENVMENNDRPLLTNPNREWKELWNERSVLGVDEKSSSWILRFNGMCVPLAKVSEKTQARYQPREISTTGQIH